MSEVKDLLIEVVNKIPRRRVAYFGQIGEVISERLEKKISGQVIGRMLSSMKEAEWIELPWWRVVNKQGYVSSLKLGQKGIQQIHLLQKEGIPIHNNSVDIEIFGVETEVLQAEL